MAFTGDARARFYRDLAERRQLVLERIAAGELRTPTLLTWGFNDPSAEASTSAIAAMNLIMPNVAHSELHIFNQAGHYSYRERPSAFARVVADFLQITN